VPSAEEIAKRMRGFTERLRAAIRRRLIILGTKIAALVGHRALRRPYELIHERSRRLDELALRAAASANAFARARRARLETLAGKLQSLGPLAVLERGYTVTTDESGRVLRDASRLRRGQTIITRFAKGTAKSKVDSVDE
jgi:exodeoxyribonuclease VII large subunit